MGETRYLRLEARALRGLKGGGVWSVENGMRMGAECDRAGQRTQSMISVREERRKGTSLGGVALQPGWRGTQIIRTLSRGIGVIGHVEGQRVNLNSSNSIQGPRCNWTGCRSTA